MGNFIDLDNNVSFSGADMVATIELTGVGDCKRSFVLGSISDMTLSTHRPAFEVLSLGDTRARGFTRGPRVVAGQLVFVMFDRHLLYEISEYLNKNYTDKNDISNAFIEMMDEHEDELPLFDVIIHCNSGLGMSHMVVKGIQLVDSQLGFGINTTTPNIVYTYVAIDYKPLTPGMFTSASSKKELKKSNIFDVLISKDEADEANQTNTAKEHLSGWNNTFSNWLK